MLTRSLCLAAVLTLAACATRPDAPPWRWPEDWRAAAVTYCLGDGRPGGELAACQHLVEGDYR